MNNEQFRKLLADTPNSARDGMGKSPAPAGSSVGTLGSRTRANIPMTPRTVKGTGSIDFAAQIAERNAASQPTKKFRSSAAPKGTKLAAGYQDRTQERHDEEEDDKAKRIKSLEESMKLGQIDLETFEKLRDSITGGDISSTHLVKGLDRRLLERVRRGENVYTDKVTNDNTVTQKSLDDEFDELENQEVVPVKREKAKDDGDIAVPPPIAGQKRTRDAIIAELKAARKAAAKAKVSSQPQLGSRFRKIGEKQEDSRIERDEKGREVLIVTDQDGNVKRKIRKAKAAGNVESLPMPKENAEVLGADVVVPEAPQAESSDDDVFAGVGADYNPLGDVDNTDSSASEGDREDEPAPTKKPSAESEKTEIATNSAAKPAPKPSAPRNYFNDNPSTQSPPREPGNPLSDPSLIAALRKADKLKLSAAKSDGGDSDRSGSGSDDDERSVKESARRARLAAMLSATDRDAEDLDFGFGSSRFDDAEEMEEGGGKVKLSQWRGGAGGADSGEEGRGERGGKKRKRGPKKRKGDKDSAADVMKVVEKRRQG